MTDLATRSSATGTPTPGPPMRASDADRLATVAVLSDALTRGLLSPSESSDRMAEAFAATHRHELVPLTADLPPAPVSRRLDGWWAQARQILVRSWLYLVGAFSRMSPRAKLIGTAALLLILIAIVGSGIVDGFGGGHAPGGFGAHPLRD